ncbi:MAG TPA: hypothetical protein VGF67_30095 [Ktedonobacteraceae bacterium]
MARDRHLSLPIVRQACRKLILFLNEPASPRSTQLYQELYDNFFAALLLEPARKEWSSAFLLQRLAEALASVSPGKFETLLANFRHWSGPPQASMEQWARRPVNCL